MLAGLSAELLRTLAPEHPGKHPGRVPGRVPGRILLTGWFSFVDGEVTAGDLLAQRQVSAALDRAGLAHDTAWSPGFRPGARPLEAADPARYGTVVFACGPLHGRQLTDLHTRFARCRRIAVGVSVVDAGDPAVTGFDQVLARDGDGTAAQLDLAASAPLGAAPPVVGVVLTHGQGEYGARRSHGHVAETLTGWIHTKDCARVETDTRLAVDDWRLCSTAEQFMALVGGFDLVLTTRLHGLVLALRAGTPVLAVDPVRGGAKLSAQAGALHWPALLGAEQLSHASLDRWWTWCLSTDGTAAAARRAGVMRGRSGDAPRQVRGAS
ncbi:polysaccharide pyruvyl transferase family protein [Streptomyces aurantiacus]|uniref:Polysaccharide pyruvyl transferase n=1 Tax=Streptomyces aurantiacus TaxID=47760 RepID=A0A7G1NU46_9ACTN|nr:polysaccharide pyruvyl transferase [Streptomyces aurantiacus]